MWVAEVNKRVFNPMERRRGKRPVITHVGRSSGRTYHTPLDAHPVEGGFIFILMYGSQSDWVRNVLSAGEARLINDGVVHRLVTPRIITHDEARKQLPDTLKAPPGFFNVTEYLRMDLAA
jgi:deazaflavin-dependent oxidoreductase (nitroreductase family)